MVKIIDLVFNDAATTRYKVRQTILSFGLSPPAVVHAEVLDGVLTRHTWYSVESGKVRMLEGTRLFCCGCAAVREYRDLSWWKTPEGFCEGFCRTCLYEVPYIFELRARTPHELHHLADIRAAVTLRVGKRA